jgi:hypothetical protein
MSKVTKGSAKTTPLPPDIESGRDAKRTKQDSYTLSRVVKVTATLVTLGVGYLLLSRQPQGSALALRSPLLPPPQPLPPFDLSGSPLTQVPSIDFDQIFGEATLGLAVNGEMAARINATGALFVGVDGVQTQVASEADEPVVVAPNTVVYSVGGNLQVKPLNARGESAGQAVTLGLSSTASLSADGRCLVWAQPREGRRPRLLEQTLQNGIPSTAAVVLPLPISQLPSGLSTATHPSFPNSVFLATNDGVGNSTLHRFDLSPGHALLAASRTLSTASPRGEIHLGEAIGDNLLLSYLDGENIQMEWVNVSSLEPVSMQARARLPADAKYSVVQALGGELTLARSMSEIVRVDQWDISEPENPQIVGSEQLSGQLGGLSKRGNTTVVGRLVKGVSWLTGLSFTAGAPVPPSPPPPPTPSSPAQGGGRSKLVEGFIYAGSTAAGFLGLGLACYYLPKMRRYFKAEPGAVISADKPTRQDHKDDVGVTSDEKHGKSSLQKQIEALNCRDGTAAEKFVKANRKMFLAYLPMVRKKALELFKLQPSLEPGQKVDDAKNVIRTNLINHEKFRDILAAVVDKKMDSLDLRGAFNGGCKLQQICSPWEQTPQKALQTLFTQHGEALAAAAKDAKIGTDDERLTASRAFVRTLSAEQQKELRERAEFFNEICQEARRVYGNYLPRAGETEEAAAYRLIGRTMAPGLMGNFDFLQVTTEQIESEKALTAKAKRMDVAQLGSTADGTATSNIRNTFRSNLLITMARHADVIFGGAEEENSELMESSQPMRLSLSGYLAKPDELTADNFRTSQYS